ncbi:UvrD-helicase domain-containing protein [Flavobacteriaceae bacterium]|nr:UvrD-helicase domain-containing protein [Flavobacteriaceae bacterium]MDC1491730.1 UvrD-helicase domain-containing protein [Flavobacteriaceae bacterium]
MNNLLQNLNPSQLEPTLQTEGPMIVIAGAGSGKTRVLTYKIAYLMSKGVDAFNILALTFTNKAAKEMKERISSMLEDNESKNLWIGTFHSVFAKILRIEADKLGYPTNFTIYDTQDSQKLVSSIISELNLDKEIYKYKQIYSRISSYKNSLITVKAYNSNNELIEADRQARRPRLIDIYSEYVNRCFKSGAMDFDDLLLKTNELLSRFPEVLSKYQNMFKYVLVDEYQDTNHSQYLIVKALSDKFQNICVVGDDAQSIYGFRGANINNILNFQKDYDDVKLFKLEQNYRSTKNIVKAANSLIEKNQKRLEKVVWTANDEGSKIKVNRLLTDGEEGRFVASSIFENKNSKQLQNKDFAILYRTNAQSRAFEDSLRKRNIPYRVYGGLSFYQRKEIKDVLAYLRLIINENDEEAFKRVINFPTRGIGQTTINKLVIAANNLNISLYNLCKELHRSEINISSGIKLKIINFINLIESFKISAKTKNAFDIANEVVNDTGIIKTYSALTSIEDQAKIQNIEEMLNGIKDFVEIQKEIPESTGSISEFLEDVALATDLDKDDQDTNKVALMTIHLAKGLEFPIVYIVGLEENLFPSAMNLNSRNDLEEERRLFYVALTRAEREAYLSYALSRYRWGKLTDSEPSRFIEEINEEYLDILTSVNENKFRPLIRTKPNNEPSFNKLRFKKVTPKPKGNFKKLKVNSNKSNLFDNKLAVGNIVEHIRFGKGEVINIEGRGADIKAEIKFENGGLKKLLLRFAKLKIIA